MSHPPPDHAPPADQDAPGPHTGPARFREPRDPGTPLSRLIAGVLAIGLFIMVAGLQALSALAEPSPPPGQQAAAPIHDTGMDQFGLTCRLYVMVLHGLGIPDQTGEASEALIEAAPTRRDTVRAVIVQAELAGDPEPGAERALATIDALAADIEARATLDPDNEELAALLEDIATLRAIYTHGPASLDDISRDRLLARHGWFARLALVFGLDADDAERAALLRPAQSFLFVVLAAVTVVPFALIAGFVLLVVGVVLLANRSIRPRFVPPAPGGSVYLEILVVFLLGFLLVKVFAGLLSPALNDEALIAFSLVMQAGLVLVLFWPLVRGVTFARWKAATGWHAPRGVAREIGCGVLGYLAALPVFAVGVLVSLFLSLLWAAFSAALRGEAAGPPPTPQNAPVDLVLSGNPVIIVALFLMATVWAPIVEETVFRGALYRHLRARRGAVLAGLVTALLFAFMHGYGPLFVAPLIALGFMFALLREWRGSLIAPVTAHFIHNFVTLSALLLLMHLLGD